LFFQWLLKLEERQKERVVEGELNRKTSSQAGDNSSSGHADDEAEKLAGRRSPGRRRGAKKSANASKPQVNDQRITSDEMEQRAETLQSDGEWTEVAKKGGKQKTRKQTSSKKQGSRANVAANLVRRRSPKLEAVTISEPKDGLSYAEVMKRVMQEVDLKEIGVEVSGSRRTKSGAILLEVKEKEAADRLANCIIASLGGKATISGPSRTTKVLVVNIADWLEDDRVTEDIKRADTGLVSAKIVIRSNSGGGRVAIVDAPMDVAVRLSEQAHITVGFNRCRVKLLEKRQQQCYRCRAVGHLAALERLWIKARDAIGVGNWATLLLTALGQLPSAPAVENFQEYRYIKIECREKDGVLEPILEVSAAMMKFLQINLNHCKVAQTYFGSARPKRM